MSRYKFVFIFLALLWLNLAEAEVSYDANGYIVYCPCMGRFGNQVDHLLGSLAFAKKLNRTLVIPPWIGHTVKSQYKNSFIPYDTWFKADALNKYHKTVLMEDFMKNLAPAVWPSEKRTVYCFEISLSRSKDKQSCPAKEGNPFGPFWNNFNVEFFHSATFPSYLRYDSSKEQWDIAFPSSKHLVLALMGAPASYPVKAENRQLQKYVEWSDEIDKFTTAFISSSLKLPYVAVHLRNGYDWKRACEHVVGDGLNYAFMSSPQCVGEGSSGKKFTKELCYPSKENVLKQTLDAVRQVSAKSLFIATDQDSYKSDFIRQFENAGLSVDVVTLGYNALEKDLALLIKSEAFIGNCGSSFTAFVVRKRNTRNKSNFFFGVVDEKVKSEL